MISLHSICSDVPIIDIPSSKILCSIFNFVSPSEIACNLSDSFTLSSAAFLITVFPSAKHAAMLNIGISSIIFGIMSSETLIPFNLDDFTKTSPTISFETFL